eukprot:s118_g44.t1
MTRLFGKLLSGVSRKRPRSGKLLSSVSKKQQMRFQGLLPRIRKVRWKKYEEVKEESDDEEKPVILPRALLHRLGYLAKALQQQGLLHEKYMAQSHGDLEKCAGSLADLCQTVKVPTEMFAHIGSLADGVSYYAGEVKRMLSINKEEKSKWNWDWLQDGKAKKPMSAYAAPAGPPPAAPEGVGAFDAYGAFPPSLHNSIRQREEARKYRRFRTGWGNSYDSRHRATDGSVAAGVHGGGEIPVPTNPPPEEIVVQWSGFAPMVAPNMNNDAISNPPLTYELLGEVPNLKSMSAIGIDRQTGRRRRISPEGKQMSHRNATSAAYAPKGWTQSVNTLLFHRVYENL